jgi:16S rRNA (cytosine967-C5)-methyltransferase
MARASRRATGLSEVTTPGARSNPQTIAARVLCGVIEGGKFLDTALELVAAPPASRALVQEMCYGTAREWHRLGAIAGQLLHKPLKDETVRALLHLGLYQLRAMRAPAHAVVAETVEAAAHLRKPWAKGLINACLRGYLRDARRAEAAIAHDIEARHSHPRWLIERLQAAYPHRWEAILAANNERPPMALRVNARKTTRADYLARLAAEGIAAHEAPGTEHGVVLATPLPVERLPGFAEGEVSVQDAAAQLAVPLLDVPRGARVLDACAAPGGKTGHLLERHPEAEVVAVEIDPQRKRRIEDNLARLGLAARAAEQGPREAGATGESPQGRRQHEAMVRHDLAEAAARAAEQGPREAGATGESPQGRRQDTTMVRHDLAEAAARVLLADATRPQDWWDGRPFERILLDPPCSASGVIRRHPDIKLRRQPRELALLADTQQRLLAALWPLLAPGGKLLYVTCSVLPEENERTVEAFLADHRDAAEAPLALAAGVARAHGRQILPGDDGMDGFYYAALRKRRGEQ